MPQSIVETARIRLHPGATEAALIAACAAVIYGTLAWILGDQYPFSRYAMYADLGGRSEGAVLVVRIGGREVDFQDVVAWSGVNPELIEPLLRDLPDRCVVDGEIVLPAADAALHARLAALLDVRPRLAERTTLVLGRSHDALEASDAVLVASGTASISR